MANSTATSWFARARDSSAVQFIRSVSEERDKMSVRILNVVLFPGVVARVGIREVTALILRVRVLHFGFSKAPGGHVAVEDAAPSWKRFLVVLGAPLILLPLGALISSQLIIDQLTIQSFVPVPDSFDSEGYVTILAETLFRYGDMELFQMWCSVSCWYMLIVPHKDVMAVIAGSRGKPGVKGIPWFLRPVALVSWLATRAGPFGGLAAVFLSYFITGWAIRFLVRWRLGV